MLRAPLGETARDDVVEIAADEAADCCDERRGELLEVVAIVGAVMNIMLFLD